MILEPWTRHISVWAPLLVPGIYIFRLHNPLLLSGLTTKVTITLFGTMLVSGVILSSIHGYDRASLGVAVALASPLLHVLAFRRAYSLFLRVVHREPRDTFLNWKPGLAADRMFAMTVMGGLPLASMMVIGYFHWGLAI